MSKKTRLILTICIGLGLLFIYHVSMRSRGIDDLLSADGVRERANIMPQRFDLNDVDLTLGESYSIGHVDLFIPEDRRPVVIKNVSGGAFVLETKFCRFGFLRPVSYKGDYENGESITPLDALIENENTGVLPLWKILILSREQMEDYRRRIGFKASNRLGFAGVYTFQSNSLRGLILVGNSSSDQRIAHVSLQDDQKKMNMGVSATLIDGVGGNILEEIKPVLKTISFKERTQ